jgi:hypothetical protein
MSENNYDRIYAWKATAAAPNPTAMIKAHPAFKVLATLPLGLGDPLAAAPEALPEPFVALLPVGLAALDVFEASELTAVTADDTDDSTEDAAEGGALLIRHNR